MDCYDTLIQQHDMAEATAILADECRKKDRHIELLVRLLIETRDKEIVVFRQIIESLKGEAAIGRGSHAGD